MQDPLNAHWQAVKKIRRYLKGTISDGLLFSPTSNLMLTAFSDVDWAANLDDRKSVSDYCVLLGFTPVSWNSKKQSIVS